MTSFATITPEGYKKLVDNERKIFDLYLRDLYNWVNT